MSERKPKITYFVVAHEADLVGGQLRLGPDTRAACDMAVTTVLDLIRDGQGIYTWDDFSIVVAAKEKAGWPMTFAEAMAQYLRSKPIPEEVIVTLRAPVFYTVGEVFVLVRYLKRTPSVRTVVTCVKDWHVLRCQVFLLCFLSWEKMTQIEVTARSCDSRPQPKAIQREFWIGVPKNMLVLIFLRILYLFGYRVPPL